VAKILLAEDDESMRAFLTRSLSRVGHDVCSVSDGFEALPHIEGGEFDLLVTDIVMPGMDGLELARRISLETPDTKVIFITGFAAVSLNNHASQQSDAKVLSKPFHLRAPVDEIDRVLAVA
jgi:two-component system cell cycle response regulator CpdR